MVLASIVQYADDTAGLEKTLRLLQGFCTIASGLPQSFDLETALRLRSQFALGRRYFRFLKWHPCWNSAVKAFEGRDRSSLYTLLDVSKWFFLGGYFFLEMFTTSNAMGVTNYDWGPKVQREANKSWFYALVLSILVTLSELSLTPALRETATNANSSTKGLSEDEKKPANSKPPVKNNQKLYMQLVIDGCDLFIPGSAVGWIPVGPVFVGIASTISSTLAGQQIWDRVQTRSKQS